MGRAIAETGNRQQSGSFVGWTRGAVQICGSYGWPMHGAERALSIQEGLDVVHTAMPDRYGGILPEPW